MRSYTLATCGYLYAVWCLGLLALIHTFLLPPWPGDSLTVMGAGLAGVLALVAGARKIEVVRSARLSEAVNMSLGFLVIFVAMLSLGVRAGVLAGLLSGFAATAFPRRQ